MSELEITILVLSLEGLLFIALGFALPGMAKSPIAGIRNRATTSDERVWRETHLRGGPRLSRLGAVILVVGLALVVAPGPDGVRLALFATVSLGGLAWYIWDITRFSNARLRYYQAVDAREAERAE